MDLLHTSFQFLSEYDAAVERLWMDTGIYTKDPVVREMLDQVNWIEVAASGGRLLDPSAGDGAFVVQALTMIDTPPGDFDTISQVMGIEIYPGAVRDARRRVAELLIARGWDEGEAKQAGERVIRLGDFLADGVPADAGRFRLIAGNPPYLRMANVPDVFKRLYASILPGFALGDILHAFLYHCPTVLEPGGSIILCTSDRWLFNDTAAKLREEIGRVLGLVYCARIEGETAFRHAKIRKKGEKARVHPVIVEFCAAEDAPIRLDARPICPDDQGTLRDEAGPTLSDIADVCLAPWLGKEGVFVLNEREANRLVSAGGRVIPVVDTDDVDSATDRLNKPTRFALITTREEMPTGEVLAHLERNRHRMQNKTRNSKTWWVPSERIAPERAGVDRLMIPRIAKQLRAVHLPAGIVAIDHNLTITNPKPGVSLEGLRQVLLSPESQAWIARNAPRLENGFLSITTNVLRRLPVPQHVADACRISVAA